MLSSHKSDVQSVTEADRWGVKIELHRDIRRSGTQIRWNIVLWLLASVTTVAAWQPAIPQVSVEFIFQQNSAPVSDSNISQGSVATRLRCDGIFNDPFIANFLLSVSVKEF